LGSSIDKKSTLCDLEEDGSMREHFDEYKRLVRAGKFVCRRCGRAARKSKNLCKPEPLK
jgi:hypothetical protein